MTVKAGYPGMRFKLYNTAEVCLWETQINELGGSETALLGGLVTDGEDYVVEVSIDSIEERLMLWEIEFNPFLFELIAPMRLYHFREKKPGFPWIIVEGKEYM
jgi:hypothetical protein